MPLKIEIAPDSASYPVHGAAAACGLPLEYAYGFAHTYPRLCEAFAGGDFGDGLNYIALSADLEALFNKASMERRLDAFGAFIERYWEAVTEGRVFFPAHLVNDRYEPSLTRPGDKVPVPDSDAELFAANMGEQPSLCPDLVLGYQSET